MTTDNIPLPLNSDQIAALADINGRLKTLIYVAPEAFAQISSNVDNALSSVGASAASLSESAKGACIASSGRFGGQQAIALRAAHDAKQKADAAVVAGIPRESLVILKIMHGDDVTKLAGAWRAQAVTGARR